MNKLGGRERWLRVLGSAAIAAGVILLYQRFPAIDSGYACPFHALTGLDCFGCGLTRSLGYASHLDLATAIQCHLMGPLLLGIAIIASVLWGSEGVGGHRVVRTSWGAWRVITIVGAIWISYGALRLFLELSKVA